MVTNRFIVLQVNKLLRSKRGDFNKSAKIRIKKYYLKEDVVNNETPEGKANLTRNVEKICDSLYLSIETVVLRGLGYCLTTNSVQKFAKKIPKFIIWVVFLMLTHVNHDQPQIRFTLKSYISYKSGIFFCKFLDKVWS